MVFNIRDREGTEGHDLTFKVLLYSVKLNYLVKYLNVQ